MFKSSKEIFCIALLFLFGLSFSGYLCAQSKESLKKKKQRINEEIHYTNKLIKENAKETANSLTNLKLIKSKIVSRQVLIETISQEIHLLNSKIDKNESLIQSLQNDLKDLKDEYAKMIYAAWKNRSSYTRLMFVFASKNFNQAYIRLKYLQQYADYRESQAKLIVKTEKQLQNKIQNLKKEKNQRTDLLGSKEKESQKLSKTRSQQQQNINQLKSKQKDLRNELKKKRAIAKKLDRAIEEIIKKEITAAREAAKAKNKKSEGSFPLSPEALKLSNSFAANKGKLPWPVTKGVITETFGKHEHPILHGVNINNNGIDISTDKSASVRAIFRGKVTGIIVIPGEGKAVMIRHGEYLSVYTYLSKVFVSKGDQINTKEKIGILTTKTSKSNSDMHLEIWKGRTKLNPQYWILNQ